MRKLHIKREAQHQQLDLTNLTDDEIDELLKRYKTKKSKPYMLAKNDYDMQEFKRIVKDFKEEKAKL